MHCCPILTVCDGVNAPYADKDYFLALQRSGELKALSCLPDRCLACNSR